jgi:hypothetical protein
MIERFRKTRFRPDSLSKIEKMVEIVEEYQTQGLRLTARQLYYQFVSRDIIPNTPAEYKKLTSLLADARYAGLVDWDAIEDRGRQPERASEWDNISALVESALRSYRLPRWRGQGKYIELWVEKQALAGVLWPLAHRYHATLMVNKGYSSASAMYESANRINGASEPENIIFYLGDHDPSGEDMVRDIEDRLVEFGVEDLTVTKIALNMSQIKQYNPPPNPAKMTDSRAVAYVNKFGNQSWEVDALPPNVLAQLVRDAFDQEIDVELMDKVKAREEADKQALRKAAEKLVKKS